jgi:hypothetical protein
VEARESNADDVLRFGRAPGFDAGESGDAAFGATTMCELLDQNPRFPTAVLSVVGALR